MVNYEVQGVNKQIFLAHFIFFIYYKSLQWVNVSAAFIEHHRLSLLHLETVHMCCYIVF